MQINSRLEDLTTVFDKTWKANHNDDIQKARAKEKNFMNKMFNVKVSNNTDSIGNKFRPLTEQEKMQNRQNSMNNLNNFNNQSKINTFKGKFN